MHVIFVEPAFPTNQREFARGLKRAGAFVTGIGERPFEALDSELKSWLGAYERVSSVCNEAEMIATVRRIQQRGWVDRLEATIEAHIMPAAKVRAACGIPGTTVATAFLCRDKPAMKERLRDFDVPCAQSAGVDSASAAREFVARVGYPVIVKPRDGAGAAGTFRCDDDAELEHAIRESRLEHGRQAAIEEFIEGHEGFYDTLSIGGNVVREFVTHYYPNVLVAMRNRWISPQFITTNRLDAPGYDEIRKLGQRVIRALDIGTSATHMEWFYGSKGLKFSEIGCRPPGVGAFDLYCAAHDIDIYLEWANAIVHGRCVAPQSRRFAAGIVALRPSQDGTIKGYQGLEVIERKFGDCLIDYHLPAIGSHTQPVEAGYMANAWIRMKHPDYDRLRAILDEVGQTVKVLAH
jgi:hypothetical protein